MALQRLSKFIFTTVYIFCLYERSKYLKNVQFVRLCIDNNQTTT